MKKIKRCLLIFGVFLAVAASLFPCSASLADEGYLWDDEGGFWYIPKSEAADDETITRRSGPLRAPAASGTGTTIAFPDFDKNKIDVAGFPDYVKKLLASRTSLVWLIVGSKHLYIWVADGCIPAVSTSYGKLFLLNLKLSNARVNSVDTFFYPDDKSVFNTIPSDFICYSAKYSWNKSSDLYTNVVNDWSVAAGKKIVRYVSSTEASSVGSSFYAYYLPNSLYTATTDFYVYGNANDYFNSDKSRINYFIKNGNLVTSPGSWSDCITIYNNLIIQHYSESTLRMIDGGTFPTAESQQAETQRGILGQLKALPDKIRGFFETLENRLLWFSDDGSASYTNPFDNLLDDVKTKINGYITDVDNFNATLNDTLASVVSYVEQGSGVIQLFLTGVPLVSAFLLFFVVFAVVRKVVGR